MAPNIGGIKEAVSKSKLARCYKVDDCFVLGSKDNGRVDIPSQRKQESSWFSNGWKYRRPKCACCQHCNCNLYSNWTGL